MLSFRGDEEALLSFGCTEWEITSTECMNIEIFLLTSSLERNDWVTSHTCPLWRIAFSLQLPGQKDGLRAWNEGRESMGSCQRMKGKPKQNHVLVSSSAPSSSPLVGGRVTVAISCSFWSQVHALPLAGSTSIVGRAWGPVMAARTGQGQVGCYQNCRERDLSFRFPSVPQHCPSLPPQQASGSRPLLSPVP